MDVVPDNRHRLAYWIGRILHPYLLGLPTLVVILKDLSLSEIVLWSVLILGLLLIPGLLLEAYLRRQQQFIYQRRTRDPLYLTGWVSTLVCLGLLVLLRAPVVLIACLLTLAIWVPAQWLINRYLTKLSTHAAVAAGCASALWLLGELGTPALQILIVGLVAITMWARVVTKNHTVTQVILGLLVGILPVLIVFPLVLGNPV